MYFGRKDELTDEYGVFDIDRAKEIILQGEGFMAVEQEE